MGMKPTAGYCKRHNRKYLTDIGCPYCNNNRQRQEKHRALTDLGLKRVRGALGGVYYE